MSAAIKLYIDVQSQPGKLVGNLAGAAPPPFAQLVQGSKLNMRVYPVRPTGLVNGNAYSQIPVTSYGDIKVALGVRLGTGTIYAQAGAGTSDTWGQQITADAAGEKDYFYGILNLNTSNLNAALTSVDTVQAYFEVHLSVAGNYSIVYQQQVTILSAVIDPSGAVSLPLAASEYYTKAELDALFVPWDSRGRAANQGKNITLVSPSGTRTRALGVGDTGEGLDYVV